MNAASATYVTGAAATSVGQNSTHLPAYIEHKYRVKLALIGSSINKTLSVRKLAAARESKIC